VGDAELYIQGPGKGGKRGDFQSAFYRFAEKEYEILNQFGSRDLTGTALYRYKTS
jgi:hypothetical protein